MNLSNIENFSHLLEVSFAPIVLISGVGLLLLSMVNRFMQAMNRTRELMKEVESQEGQEKQKTIRQIKILYKRSNLLKWAITIVSGSILSTGLLIFVVSIMSFYQYDMQYLALLLYFISIALMLLSIFLFLYDLSMSTRALGVETSKYIDLEENF